MIGPEPRLVASPVLLDGLAAACPVADPPLAVAEPVVADFLFDGVVEVAVEAARVDPDAMAFAPVIGIWVKCISSGPSVVVITRVSIAAAPVAVSSSPAPATTPEAVHTAVVVPPREQPTVPVLSRTAQLIIYADDKPNTYTPSTPTAY